MSKFLQSDYDTDSQRRSRRRRWVETTDVERDLSGISAPEDEMTDSDNMEANTHYYRGHNSHYKSQHGVPATEPRADRQRGEIQERNSADYSGGNKSNKYKTISDKKIVGNSAVKNKFVSEFTGEYADPGFSSYDVVDRKESYPDPDKRSRGKEEENAMDGEAQQRIEDRNNSNFPSVSGEFYPSYSQITSTSTPTINCYCSCKCKERVVYIEGPTGKEGKQGKEGPKGKDGEQGPEGPGGKSGPPGQDGRDGIDGTNGRDGRDGKDGKRGPKGPPGGTGRQGEDGKQGPRGDPGRPGKEGPPGKDGRDGKDGVDGRPGRDGKDGRDGTCVCANDPFHNKPIIKTRFITKGGKRTLSINDSDVVIDSSSNVTLTLPPSPVVLDSKDTEDYYVESRVVTVCSINGIHNITTASSDSKINSFLSSMVIGRGTVNTLVFFSDGRGNWIARGSGV